LVKAYSSHNLFLLTIVSSISQSRYTRAFVDQRACVFNAWLLKRKTCVSRQDVSIPQSRVRRNQIVHFGSTGHPFNPGRFKVGVQGASPLPGLGCPQKFPTARREARLCNLAKTTFKSPCFNRYALTARSTPFYNTISAEQS
jgi:hypothetical protein